MARIVLILVVCTAVMFFLVLQTPPKFIQQALDGFASLPGISSPEEAEEEKEPEAKPAEKTRKPATTLARRTRTESPQPEAPAVAPVSSQPATLAPLVFSVATDETALYSLNSTDGPVVSVLRKGDIVEPQLEIRDAGQTWAYVNVAGRRTSGFLRKDDLERRRLLN